MDPSTDFLARYADGEIAEMRDTVCRVEIIGAAPQLTIKDLESRQDLARWPVAETFPAHGRKGEMRIGTGTRASGARLVVGEADEISRAAALLPDLARKARGERRQQAGFIGVSTVLLAGLVAGYIFGVPLLAGQLVNLIPPAMEKRIGDAAAMQVEASFDQSGGGAICDPDPDSLANVAINRFANAALAGTGSPFTANVTVVRSTIANAFALPGGKAFFYSGLLEHTETPDEFAGVLAHEMGHVVHRDGMQQLISSASTGLLIGFVLGDMSGLSVAGGLGTTLLDSHFSRAAEANADRFAAETAGRLRFQPVGLANLLERVAADDSTAQAMAFLSDHPLTDERRLALEALRVDDNPDLPPAFTNSEWQAIKAMCGPPAASDAVPAAAGDASAPAPKEGPSHDQRQRDKEEAGA